MSTERSTAYSNVHNRGLFSIAEEIRKGAPGKKKTKMPEQQEEVQWIDVDTGALLERLSKLKPQVEPAVPLLSLFQDFFGVRKGAFLLSEGSDGLIPYALKGYDATTQARLRLPLSMVGDEPLIIDESLAPLRPYFSMREFDMLTQVLLLPFRDGDELLGLCLISEPAAHPSASESLNIVYQKIHEPISAFLRSCFPARLRGGGMPKGFEKIDSNEIAEKISRISESLLDRGNKILFLRLHIGALVQTVSERLDSAIPFRVREEIHRLLKKMVTGIGDIMILEADIVLLAIMHKSVSHPDMFVHQIRGAVERMYIEDLPMPEYRVSIYPDADTDIAAVISELIT